MHDSLDQQYNQPRDHQMIAIIAAIASNGVIGSKGKLPWHLPSDLIRFRELTFGHSLIMGRRTWETIGKPLYGRECIVVSRDNLDIHPEVKCVESLKMAYYSASLPNPVFVIGGEYFYRQSIKIAMRLYLTEIKCEFDGDVRFPPINKLDWRETHRESHKDISEQGLAYDFVEYERIQN